MTLPLIVAEGTPYEIGVSYGRQAAELIAGNFADYLVKFRVSGGHTPADVTRLGEEFRPTTQRYAPRIAAMLDGVAEGSGLPVGDIYALNARTELMVPRISECTGVAVLPEHTASGHTLLGQNWDWHPSQSPFTLVLATRDERGHEVLALAEAGMLAKAGLNSAGVGVGVNLLTCDRDGGPGGVPYHVLIRAVLDAPEGISVALGVCSLPRSASINLLIGVAGGVAVDLELAPGLTGRVLPTDGILTHSNHFVSGIGVRDRFYDLGGGSSLFRDFRLRQVLEAAAAERRVEEKDVIAALQDHLGYPYAICRHIGPEDPEELWSVTVSSVVMDLDDRRMLVTNGTPCGNAYQSIELRDVFDSARPLSGV
ncbi:C45 family peptidase [Longispora sp. K20-0274]|uniref:C45 family autoproteolytic acyltransferase/hydolase n=1 Tax=Longispora sp. K20-0274 TaxID=3088255 RepID=UPI00399A642E